MVNRTFPSSIGPVLVAAILLSVGSISLMDHSVDAAEAVVCGLGVAPVAEACQDPELWVAEHSGPGGGMDYVRAVVASPDGERVFVTGTSVGDGTQEDFATIAYDTTTGQELWVARYDGPEGTADRAWAIEVDPQGTRVFVAGSTAGEGTLIVAYDADSGQELWMDRETATGTTMVVSPDGTRLYASGSNDLEANAMTTASYNTTTGEPGWTASYLHSDDSFSSARAIGVDQDGTRVFVLAVVNFTWGVITSDMGTFAYDAETGEELWNATHGDPALWDTPQDLVVGDENGLVFVTGQEGTGTQWGRSFVTLAYDMQTGDETWTTHYEGPDERQDRPMAIGYDPSGSRVFVTGWSWLDGGGGEYATVSYDAATGTETWIAQHNGPAGGTDEARDLVVAPDGSKVFVTGRSHSETTSADYGTIAYDALTGMELWEARYEGIADDFSAAEAITIDPKGENLFVTGISINDDGVFDYATVTYDTRGPRLLDPVVP